MTSPGVRRLRRDERREETRTLLLQSAARLFARRGYHGVSLDAVADEAGFTKGAVYAHFASKQDLLASLLELHCNQQLAQVRSMLALGASIDERIRLISDHYFGSSGDVGSWYLLFVELWAQAMREANLRPRLVGFYDDMRRSIAEMIVRETDRLEMTLALPAEDVAQSLLAIGDGLMMQHVLAPSERTARSYFSTMSALFQSALRSPDESR